MGKAAFTSGTSGPVLIGLGSNLPGRHGESPRLNILRALELLEGRGIFLKRLSPLYESEPVPKSAQPWFFNAAAEIATGKSPQELLEELLSVERAMGRTRRVRNEARIIDLDLLAFGDRLIGQAGGKGLVVPHPRLHERPFVLLPLADIAPGWLHPVLKKTVRELLAGLPQELHSVRRAS